MGRLLGEGHAASPTPRKNGHACTAIVVPMGLRAVGRPQPGSGLVSLVSR